ncbi:hypothetical protein ZOSMA_62G00350 [Zostera marina]|uniref:Uncharacterized protein n=1 Tax=Zostera marina TaxID=29655 RepID=A0A0K9NT91_ZOSMR|nr:hypothetical protein ZOSMA_62G00350 [Zostera marina]
MDSKYVTEIFQHLENHGEHLMDVKRSLAHELHRLHVEEEMLMRKLFEVMEKNKAERLKSSLDADNQNEFSKSL